MEHIKPNFGFAPTAGLLQFINRVAPENLTFLYFSDIFFFSRFIRLQTSKVFFARVLLMIIIEQERAKG